jgi:hypothetical protein
MMTRLRTALAAALIATPSHAQTLEETIARFYADSAAWRVTDDFREIARERRTDADAWAWAAETERLTDEDPERATDHALWALEIEPCHAMAHATLGAIHLRGTAPGAADSAWAHAARAVECDPEDGNAWLVYWDAAALRGDGAAEAAAQRRLGEMAFFSAPVLEFARWTLNAAPRDAVVLTSGDEEYYPLRVAQTAGGIRTDVLIVRTTHLAVPVYVRRIAKAADYPVPPEVEGTDEGVPIHRDGPSPLQLAAVKAWVDAHLAGGSRPLALTAITDLAFAGNFSWGLLRRAGPVITIHPTGRLSDPLFAAEAYEAAWRDLDLRRLDGPLTSEGDRSAVRRNTLRPSEIVLLLYAAYAGYQGGHDQPELARQALGWAQQVMDTGAPRPEFSEFLDEAKRDVP